MLVRHNKSCPYYLLTRYLLDLTSAKLQWRFLPDYEFYSVAPTVSHLKIKKYFKIDKQINIGCRYTQTHKNNIYDKTK